MKYFASLLLLAHAVPAATTIVKDVRTAIAENDFKKGESLIREYREQRGVHSEMILALSWLGRGALAAKGYGEADRYAAETRQLALAQILKHPLDQEANLPLALGASIEVQAHVMDSRGQRGEAVTFLRRELKTYYNTSIRTRIQKNIHLLSLEGKEAPALEIAQHLGPKPTPLASLMGKPVLLFFWAHWCGDCKQLGPILAGLASKYARQGLVVIGPTQRYGYVAGGRDAVPEEETPYIDAIRKQFYGDIAGMAVPVSEDNFRNYGASTTPTLVLVDRKGVVQLYNPGKMTSEALESRIRRLLE
jgi:thiol-disulfide isomerase/thioredoxin